MEHAHKEQQVSINIDDAEICTSDSESNEVSSRSDQFGFFLKNGMIKIEEGNKEREIIKRSFLLGMGPFEKETKIVAIHKNSYSTPSGQMRLEAFRIFSKFVARKCGGDANVKHAWYGGSRDELCEIICYGFSRCGRPANTESYGFGVYLSPAKFSIDGALSSIPDENGLRHILLCRVILGKMEAVSPGSKQFHPSSAEFDSGVDDLLAPRRYIVWSHYMNTHIFPNYIVSFKAQCYKGSQRIRPYAIKPTSRWMRFCNLLSILSRFLPPNTVDTIARYHQDFHENKITRSDLIQRVRQIAGDELLIRVMAFYSNLE